MTKVCFVIFLFLLNSLQVLSQLPQEIRSGVLFRTDAGRINFISDAPLELIKASSASLRGILRPGDRTFAFMVDIRSLEGFNSPIQQEHFYENYMEADKYTASTFQGKIIEQTDLTAPGSYEVRAKGMLSIHGVQQERIIKCQIIVEDKRINVTSSFLVPLPEHNIHVPSIVNQKIAQEIQVEVEATLYLSQAE